jgi:hypothetical protein
VPDISNFNNINLSMEKTTRQIAEEIILGYLSPPQGPPHEEISFDKGEFMIGLEHRQVLSIRRFGTLLLEGGGIISLSELNEDSLIQLLGILTLKTQKK